MYVRARAPPVHKKALDDIDAALRHCEKGATDFGFALYAPLTPEVRAVLCVLLFARAFAACAACVAQRVRGHLPAPESRRLGESQPQ